jgi:glutathione synthase/RimK-type ligase-like ATP-grasp enzyme
MNPSRSRRVALVTCDKYPDLYEDDLLLRSALEACALDAEPVVWSDPSVVWNEFAIIVVRSPWDYFERLSEFRQWLEARIAGKVPMCNAGELLLWNLDKRYLADLQAAGVALVPTAFLERGSRPDVESIARERGWREIVVKPAISGGAYRTYRFAIEEAPNHTGEIAEILLDRGVLVQPFMPEILRDGELSLVFLDGEFSHAVRKRARAGDYRVQFQYGGTDEDVQVSATLIDQARACVRAAPIPPVYARVDGLISEERFLLMELEVLEPLLFLGRASGAAMRLARAITHGLTRIPSANQGEQCL